jgi:methionyl-tRNA formyltransferase
MATYSPSVKSEDAVIDWTLSAVDVWRRVRAYSPWPTATTTVDGQPLRILEACSIDAPPAPPGTVMPLPEGVDAPPGSGFAVACGQGALAVVRGQRAGKRPLSGEELLRGYLGLMGKRLG